MTKTRLDYIDGLRGIAVSAVLVQHVADYVMERAPGRSSVLRMIFVDSFDSGRFGIALFFLISGFVIPFSFRRPSAVLRFVITRFFRLYPAYWLSLVTAIIVLYTFFSVNIGLDTILFNFTMFEMAFGRPVVLGPYWTLIIELIFYAMCVGIFLIGRLSDWRFLLIVSVSILLGSLCLTLYASILGIYLSANFLLNLALMFLGTIFRRAIIEKDTYMEAYLSPVFLVFIVVTLVTFVATPDRHAPLYTRTSFCSGYLLALALFFIAVKSETPNNYILVYLGTVSYSLYLFHDICLTMLKNIISSDQLETIVVFSLASSGLSIIIAVCVYHLVERPAISIGRDAVKRLCD